MLLFLIRQASFRDYDLVFVSIWIQGYSQNHHWLRLSFTICMCGILPVTCHSHCFCWSLPTIILSPFHISCIFHTRTEKTLLFCLRCMLLLLHSFCLYLMQLCVSSLACVSMCYSSLEIRTTRSTATKRCMLLLLHAFCLYLMQLFVRSLACVSNVLF
jgi:hypothetical protein